ncbi:MAG: hypothetical protein HYR70_00465 [Chloroflexi bacterium]|nr:hypothetical protein [Chloroflexota bacterium]
MKIIDDVSNETIRQVLDDNELKPWRKREWRIPPQANSGSARIPFHTQAWKLAEYG